MLVKQKKNKTFFKLFFSLFLLVSVFLFGLFLTNSSALAQTTYTEDNYLESSGDIMLPGVGMKLSAVQAVVRVINVFLGILGLIAVILIMRAGFIWMTANGNPERVMTAKRSLAQTLIGMAVILLAFVIVNLTMRFIIDAVTKGRLDGQTDPVNPPGGPGGPGDNEFSRFSWLDNLTANGGDNNADNVYLCSDIQSIFSKYIRQESFDEFKGNSNIKIVKREGGSETEVSSPDKFNLYDRNIIYKHGSDWDMNSSYRIYIPTDLKSITDETIEECLAEPACQIINQKFVWDFETGNEVDLVAPEVVSTDPDDEEVDVYLDTLVSVNFNENIDVTSMVLGQNLKLFDEAGQDISDLILEEEIRFFSKKVRFEFEDNLEPFTTYQVVLSGIRDLCGNEMEDDYSFSFTTGNETSNEDDLYLKVINRSKCQVSGGSIETNPSPNPYKDADDICVNVRISAEFSKKIDTTSLVADSIFVLKCQEAEDEIECLEENKVSGVLNFSAVTELEDRFTFDPANNLEANTYYKVVLKKDGLFATDGTTLKRDYVWFFETSENTSECVLKNVNVMPYKFVANKPAQEIDYEATAFADRCQEINSQNLNWHWSSSDKSVATVSPRINSAKAVASVLAVDDSGRTDIMALYQTKSDKGILRYDPGFCYTNDDCQDPDGDGILDCPYSGCDESRNKCTPSLNSANPVAGRAGRVVTLEGCYFGNRKGNVYFDNVTTTPTTCQDGNSWSENEIITEIPYSLDTEESKTIDLDLMTGNDFESNVLAFKLLTKAEDCPEFEKIPAICDLSPEKTRVEKKIDIRGENLLSNDFAGEQKVIFTGATVNNTSTTIEKWTTTTIDNIFVNENVLGGPVKLSFDRCQTNSLNLSIIGQDCNGGSDPNKCTVDQGKCGRGLFCSDVDCTCQEKAIDLGPAPKVVDYSPGNGVADVCPNAGMVVDFNTLISTKDLEKFITIDREVERGTECEVEIKEEELTYNKKNKQNSLLGFLKNVLGKIVKKASAESENNKADNMCPVSFSVKTSVYDYYSNPDNPESSSVKATRVYIYPRKMWTDSTYYIRFNKDIQSIKTRKMGSDFYWTYATGDQICAIEKVSIEPRNYIFTKRDEEKDFLANAYAGDFVLNNYSAVYPFVWSWSKKEAENNRVKPLIEAVDTANNIQTIKPALHDNYGQLGNEEIDTGVNGRATVYATASSTDGGLPVEKQRKKTGYSNITVFLCENPQEIVDDSSVGGGFAHYETMYCRGNGADQDLLLPRADVRSESKDDEPDLLSEKIAILKKGNNVTSDAIGFRVYKNSQNLSLEDWYKNINPNATPDSYSKITVDGYEAIKAGRTIYVSAANVKNGNVYMNIYLITYNDKATTETSQIFDQMIDNWSFNREMDSQEKYKLIRDVERKESLRSIALSLDNYLQINGYCPKLEVGSFLPGKTNSTWPSWQGVLGGSLGMELPIDPINEFIKKCGTVLPDGDVCNVDSDCTGDNEVCLPVCYGDYDSVSCWNQRTGTSACPEGSHVFTYLKGETGCSIYANMEYDSWSVDDTCFDYKINIE